MTNEWRALLPYLTVRERAEMDRLLATMPLYWAAARPSQRPPDGDWIIWLILAGRGFGKTRTAVEWAHYQAQIMPGSRGAIAGATAADVRDILVEGESGFLNAIAEGKRPRYEVSKRRLTWPNGTLATLFSADEPDRFRGPQHHWAIADEVCAWRYPEAWDQLLLGLRLGAHPQVVVATTPKPTALLRGLLRDPTCHVTRGSTYENRANLAPAFFSQVIRRYEGTRLGRQELNAEVLEDVEGALWTWATLDRTRVAQAPADLVRIVVGVDPKASAEADSETGIVVAGLAENGHVYILDDASLNGTPEAWAQRVIAAYTGNKANWVVPEVNQGGDMVSSVLRSVEGGRLLPIAPVRASRGKYTRAEPVAALYAQGRVHHVGAFPALEEQMCNWVPGDKSPDRVDALVWAAWALAVEPSGVEVGPNIWR